MGGCPPTCLQNAGGQLGSSASATIFLQRAGLPKSRNPPHQHPTFPQRQQATSSCQKGCGTGAMVASWTTRPPAMQRAGDPCPWPHSCRKTNMACARPSPRALVAAVCLWESVGDFSVSGLLLSCRRWLLRPYHCRFSTGLGCCNLFFFRARAGVPACLLCPEAPFSLRRKAEGRIPSPGLASFTPPERHTNGSHFFVDVN